jgi:hypothetical protein
MTAADKIFELWYKSLDTDMTPEEARTVFNSRITNANYGIQRLISISTLHSVRAINLQKDKAA